jgi:transcription antitermination factor NusG
MATAVKKTAALKRGSDVRFTSRANKGTGKITKIEAKKTGEWVTVHDKSRDFTVTVRRSQVSPL